MNSLNKRIDWIDFAKGIGIICVVCGHLAIPYLKEFVYGFHIALFFFLSGFCFSIKSYNNFFQFLIKKIKTIFIPYWFFAFIIFCYKVLMLFVKNSISKKEVIGFAKALVSQQRYQTIWFLATLFIAEILMYFVVKLIKSNYILFALAVVFAVLTYFYYAKIDKILYWNADVVLASMPFLLAGYITKGHVSKLKKISSLWVTVFSFIICTVANFTNLKINDIKRVGFYEKEFGTPILFYISAFFGILMVISLSMRLKNIKPINYLGKNSLVIFALHQIVLFGLSAILKPSELSIIPMCILWVLYGLISIGITVAFNEILINTPLKKLIGK